MKKHVYFVLIVSLILGTSYLLFHIFRAKETINESIACKNCNIIIISLSNLRKKNMSYYGSPRNTTPNIDNYFKNAFFFDHAIAPASLTFTDAASFFYSLQPSVHQYMRRKDRLLATNILRKHKSFPKELKKNGYISAAFVSDEDYTYENGIGSQFDYYFDKSSYGDNGILFKPWQYNIGTKDLISPAIEWLKENHQNKFLLFLQAYDMHCPYTPKGKFKKLFQGPYNPKIDFESCYMSLKEMKKIKRNGASYFKLYNWKSFLNRETEEGILFQKRDLDHLVNLYDAELASADDNLKAFFQEIKNLKLDKNTIVIFMSEHGDYLGENGYFMKVAMTGKGNLHNVNLSYPLMINYPPLMKKSYHQKQIIQTIDLAPSILQMLGLSIPNEMQGKSFLRILGNDLELNDYAFSSATRESWDRDQGKFLVQALQNRKWKYNYSEHRDFSNNVLEIEENLFDIENDSDEKIDLKGREPEALALMRKMIKVKENQYDKSSQ